MTDSNPPPNTGIGDLVERLRDLGIRSADKAADLIERDDMAAHIARQDKRIAALERERGEAIHAMAALVAAAGGSILVGLDVLENFRRYDLEKVERPETGGYEYRAALKGSSNHGK